MGRKSEARSWLERARSLAEVHAFIQLDEDAAKYLADLDGPRTESGDFPALAERVGQVVIELRQLREVVARAS